MADQRPIWRGHLRLALVSCSVAMYSAHRDSGSLHFHMINPKTGHRIRMVTQDSETGKDLERSGLVKGYEYKKGEYLTLSEDDFDSARVDSSSTMTINKFVDASSIDPIWFDASYFLAADGDAGLDVYKVLWKAIGEAGKAALSRIVIARRERPVAILPMGDGLIVHTLHEERDLNSFKSLFEPMAAVKTDPEMVQLARQLIERQSGHYDPADFEDRYENRLRDLIKAKLDGKGLEPVTESTADSTNVIDLIAALKRSLGSSPAKKALAKKKAPAKTIRARA